MSNKVFVGNLSFKTREPDLAKAFEEVGPVKSTNIIARGPRSLGYGFVEFEKVEDAEKSIGVMNKKEIDGRPVNVELARPRTEPAPGTTTTNTTAAPGTTTTTNGVAGTHPPRAPRPNRFPRRVAPVPGTGINSAAPVVGGVPQGNVPQTQGFRPRGPRRFPPRTVIPGQVAPQGTIPQGAPQQGMAPRPFGTRRPMMPRSAPRRAPRPHSSEISKTTLFVANLPFVVDDAGLHEIFEGMKVKEAHVVTRKDGRSKGYGFVTFENEADQLHAMQTVDKSLVENREISVHPAFAQLPPPAVPATAPTTTTATPATAPATTAPVETKQ